MEDNKVICECFNVTIQDLIDAIQDGADSFEDIQGLTKVATGCGKCEERNRELVSKLFENEFI